LGPRRGRSGLAVLHDGISRADVIEQGGQPWAIDAGPGGDVLEDPFTAERLQGVALLISGLLTG
jgi:hypothetical protein